MNAITYRQTPKHNPAATKKWACAHWCASPTTGITQQFSIP
jgi:hypothetical protein